jgi:hypothetical protein
MTHIAPDVPMMRAAWLDFHGIRYARSLLDPSTWEYLPRSATLRRDPAGRPSLTLIDLDTSGYLLLTATWGAPEDELAALRTEIATQNAVPSPDLVRLAFASVASPRCEALVGDGTGGFGVVASSATSGNPPYDALFNLTLREDQLAAARAATHGEQGRLAVEYQALLPAQVQATATFTAAGVALGDWIAAHGGGPDLIGLLDTAVQEGVARVRLDACEGDPGLITTDLYARLLDEVARTLSRHDLAVLGDVTVTVTLDKRVTEPVTAFTDIGSIIAAEPGQAPSGGHHAAD